MDGGQAEWTPEKQSRAIGVEQSGFRSNQRDSERIKASQPIWGRASSVMTRAVAPNQDCASRSRCALDARIVCHHERAASFRAQTRGAPTDLREVIALGSQFWEPGHDEVARRHAVRVSLPNPTINTERSSGGHAALVDRFRLTLRRTW